MSNPTDSTIEDSDFNGQKKRPTLLNVLLVLSTAYIASSIFGAIRSLISGPLSPEELEEQTAEMYGTIAELTENGVGQELTNMVQVMIDNSIYLNNEAFYLSNSLALITLIFGAVAVFMMFKLQKMGFHIYIIYSLLPILTMYIITPMELILTFSIVLLVFIGALFSVLYGLNLKYMK